MSRIAVIGAGPAGLTAAYQLAKHGRSVVVFEADDKYVGGISRTVEHKGFRFDIGGHRFFSKSAEVEALWTELLGADLLVRQRSSSIYYAGKLFAYPLRPVDAFVKLGPVETLRCLVSYVYAKARPCTKPVSFEDWVINQFGRRLYTIFFKTYTEKVWGIPCSEISADWAAQRIKGLSLASAVRNALFPRRSGGRDAVVKTLIDSFRYPRRGPGMLWEECARRIVAFGGEIRMGRKVVGLRYDAERKAWHLAHRGGEGDVAEEELGEIVSSAPLLELVLGITPTLPPDVRQAASSLKYRDFLAVMIVLKDRGTLRDNWVYIHDPGVRVGRVQNFKAWSSEMVPDPALNCYGLEYFCFEGDDFWSTSDDELVALAKRELKHIGLADPADVVDGCVVRQQKAYPVYDASYETHCALIRSALEERFPSLHVCGRNGMHKYNNQDHSMMTAMLVVRNILAGSRVFDVWQVNQDAEYIEEGGQAPNAGLRATPRRIVDP